MEKTICLRPRLRQMLTGVLRLAVFTLALCAGTAALILSGVLPQEAAQTGALVCGALGAFLASAFGAGRAQSGKLAAAMLPCAAWCLLCLLAGLLLQGEGWTLSPLPALLVCLGALAGALAAAQKKPRSSAAGGRRKRKRRM